MPKRKPRARRVKRATDLPTETAEQTLRIRRYCKLAHWPQAHQFLYRIAGIAHAVKTFDSPRAAPVVLVGEFVAIHDGRKYLARRLEVPEDLGREVRQVLQDNPPRNTRHRTEVYLEYDVWQVPETTALRGFGIVSVGRTWIPEPLSHLVAEAVARPIPTSPEESLGAHP